MTRHRTRAAAAAALGLAVGGSVIAGLHPRALAAAATSPAALQAEIEALKPAKLAWREIRWKSCLLEGLKESRKTKKPVLLWVFIDRPSDDARC